MISSHYIFACSGGRSGEWLNQSITIGNYAAAVGVVVTLTLIYDYCRTRNGLGVLFISLVLMATHPAWTVAAMKGDCTTPRVDWSLAYTIFFFLLLAVRYANSWMDRQQVGREEPPPSTTIKATAYED